MTYLGAGVVLLIVGVLVYLLANTTVGVVVGVIGLGLILYAILAGGVGRGRRATRI